MKREPLCYKTWAKIAAYFLLTLSVAILALSVAGIVVCWEQDVYTVDAEQQKRTAFRLYAQSEGVTMVILTRMGETDRAEAQSAQWNSSFSVNTFNRALWESEDYASLPDTYTFELLFRWVPTGGDPTSSDVGAIETLDEYALKKIEKTGGTLSGSFYRVQAKIDPAFPQQDHYYWNALMIDLLYAVRYAVYAGAAVSLVASILLFIFILSGAGHSSGHEELVKGYFFKVPFDLVTAILCAATFLVIFALDSIWDEKVQITFICVCCVAAVPVFTGWCAAFAARIKIGGWVRYTVIGTVLRAVVFILRKVGGALAAFVRGIPLIPKTLLAVVLLSAAEFVGIALCWHEPDNLLAAWVIEKLIVVPLVIWIALTLRRLQQGGRALAAGDFGYHTDTHAMLPSFRAHGEDLNSAAAGLSAAVEARLKSERLRTELITNVSHDIRTPLTSIVSYVDLLKDAETPEARAQYLEVLERQAQKLRKLTEDLIEVSKAGTGNIEVHLARASVSELLRQAMGEYEERLAAAGLEPILMLPEQELFAQLDGTLMWRVLDNLLSNACKYGQPGTRFYVDGAQAGSRVRLTFRNISRDPLNVPAEELTERFVRGDRSRTGEGSGLGLNIAQSLTELQSGTFTVTVDGDLFKAEITLAGE